MKDIIKMLVVLTAICGVCGYLLAGVRFLTKERIEVQILLNVKGPAVKRVLTGSTNDLIKDRKEVTVSGKKLVVFVGKKGDEPWAIAYEVSSKGFGGDIGVMVGFDLGKDTLTGIGITTHKETPGLGSRVGDETFTKNFTGKALTEKFHTTTNDGIIDAVTGATISSSGVCAAVRAAVKDYQEIKSKVSE